VRPALQADTHAAASATTQIRLATENLPPPLHRGYEASSARPSQSLSLRNGHVWDTYPSIP